MYMLIVLSSYKVIIITIIKILLIVIINYYYYPYNYGIYLGTISFILCLPKISNGKLSNNNIIV